MTTAELARRIRLRKRLTQAEVAPKFGVSQAYISELERGNKPGKEVKQYITLLEPLRSKPSKRTKGGEKRAGNKKA